MNANWLIETAAPLPTNAYISANCIPVMLVQAHDCYCVCLLENDQYQLAIWRTKDDTNNDTSASVSSTTVVFLDAIFAGKPLVQIAKAPREHSCWFVYAVDNHNPRRDQPQLLAWEITTRTFLSESRANESRVPLRIPPDRRMDVWPLALLPHSANHRPDAEVTSLALIQPEDTPKPILLFGTASGTALWSTQTSIPMNFNIQKVEESTSRKSILSRSIALVKYQPPNTRIVTIIPLRSITMTGPINSSTLSLLVVHWSGKLVVWEMKPPYHHFRQVSDCLVLELLREYFSNRTTHSLYDMHVQDAVASGTTVILLCNVQHSDPVEPQRYWVLVQNDTLLDVIPLSSSDHVTDFVMGTNGTPYMLLEDTLNDEQKIVTLDMMMMMTTTSSSPRMSTHALQHTMLYDGTMCPDHTTHGVLVMPRTVPSLVRARFLSLPSSKSIGSSSISSDNQLPVASSLEVDVLRSLFETWYTASTDTGRAAVSVTLNNPFIHAAVLPLAHSVPQSFRNPMERHLAYIKFLQTVGLYKFLPESTKWSLLAIGQSLEVLKEVSTTVEGQLQQTITIETIGDFLMSAQRNNSTAAWMGCLHKVLKVARDHRLGYAPPRSNGLSYDIINPLISPPGLAWTSSILQSVLEPQLSEWDSLPHGIPDISNPQLYLDIIQWILEAIRDHGDPSAYVHAAQRVFSIVRLTFGKKRDRWLFDLCRDHCYYEGVLTIHSDYTPCVAFSITTDYRGTMEPDIETGLPFKHFALKWLAEHGTAIGRAIKLHDEWPNEFYEVAETTPSLKPYQWMVDLLRDNHNKVAEDLLVRIVAPDNLELSNAGIILGAAYASNELVMLQDAANRERANMRAKVIEKKQDLLLVQYRFVPQSKMFLTSKDALNKAMKRIYDDNVEANVDDYSTALEICSTFEFEHDAIDGALLVWMQALLADKPKWLQWINAEPDLTAAHVLAEIRRSTIFGQLMEYGDELLSENSVVAWSSAWDKLGEFDDLFTHIQLRRLITVYCRSRIGTNDEMIVA